MQKRPYQTVQRIICAAGLVLLALLFVLWYRAELPRNWPLFSAAACLLLFALVCLRFVPSWFSFWFGEETPAPPAAERLPLWRLFCLALLYGVFNLAAVGCVLRYVNRNLSPEQFWSFWTAADAYHYLCIAKDWYLSEGILDRVVQLVFLPGYPLAVRAMHLLIPSYLASGMLVSALCFAGAVCVFYRLACLDLEERTARRALVFLCLMPGAFFYFTPMSESLFLLLCPSCVYSARRRRWWLAALFGALASFTRSLGLMLFVPLYFEIVRERIRGRREALRGIAALVAVPLGFAAYCLVNYLVSGDPFRFMTYQREHWHQQLGMFFNTAAYQTRYALVADRDTLMGLWGPNLAALFGAPLILLAGAKRLRPSYTAWAICYYAIAVGATWLLSAPRYMAALPPLPLALALCGEKKGARRILVVLFALAELYYLAMFALRRSVW